jgi:hypothetical protein
MEHSSGLARRASSIVEMITTIDPDTLEGLNH